MENNLTIENVNIVLKNLQKFNYVIKNKKEQNTGNALITEFTFEKEEIRKIIFVTIVNFMNTDISLEVSICKVEDELVTYMDTKLNSTIDDILEEIKKE